MGDVILAVWRSATPTVGAYGRNEMFDQRQDALRRWAVLVEEAVAKLRASLRKVEAEVRETLSDERGRMEEMISENYLQSDDQFPKGPEDAEIGFVHCSGEEGD